MPEIKRRRKFNYTEADWAYEQRVVQRELDDETEKLKALLKDDKQRRAVSVSLGVLSVAISVVVVLGILTVWALIGMGLLLIASLAVASAGNSAQILNQRSDVRKCETNITEWFMSDAEDVPFKDDTPIPVETRPMRKLEGKQYSPLGMNTNHLSTK